MTDIGADCIKTGMLHDAGQSNALFALLIGRDQVPLVGSGNGCQGGRLLIEDAVVALSEYLLPRATLLTPNIPEAEASRVSRPQMSQRYIKSERHY